MYDVPCSWQTPPHIHTNTFDESDFHRCGHFQVWCTSFKAKSIGCFYSLNQLLSAISNAVLSHLNSKYMRKTVDWSHLKNLWNTWYSTVKFNYEYTNKHLHRPTDQFQFMGKKESAGDNETQSAIYLITIWMWVSLQAMRLIFFSGPNKNMDFFIHYPFFQANFRINDWIQIHVVVEMSWNSNISELYVLCYTEIIYLYCIIYAYHKVKRWNSVELIKENRNLKYLYPPLIAIKVHTFHP